MNIALDAVGTVLLEENGRTEVDIKRYAKVEKIPGGSVEESQILRGVMLNKDVTHPKMRRYIKVCSWNVEIYMLYNTSVFQNPRIILLDCALEYKKGESQTNVEISGNTVRFNNQFGVEDV